ncbi:MAG TPA: LCP family protein [Streptosporangiaceae bacterium]|nr:LCP family protein [Streptosporangiaceae bacterium]
MDRQPDLAEVDFDERSGASARPRSGGPRFTPRTYSLDHPAPGRTAGPSRRPGFSPHPGPSRSDYPFVTEYQTGNVPPAVGKAGATGLNERRAGQEAQEADQDGPAAGPRPGGRRSRSGPDGGGGGKPGGGQPGGGRPGGPGGPGDGAKPGKSRKRKILKWASLVTTIVLVAASLTAYVAYRDVVDGIKQENVSHLLGPNRPVEYTSAQNILVIGSDSRAGTNGQFGSAQAIQGARSDTMMLLHILPDHKGAVVISFPRDSLVPIIGCEPDGTGTKGQTGQPGENEMLNATFAAGGAACLWKTLESTTGIFINHFVEINFDGFQSVVNDLGGVNVCLPEAIKDPASHLNLSAGEHHVDGTQALAFVRERHVGEGSDLQRIQRQQYFMAALVQQIESQNVLANVTKVFTIARDVAKTLTTDSGLSINDMRGIATSMKGLSTKGVQFTQVPVVQDPTDANRVLWQQPQAGSLFSEIAHDQTVKPKSSATPQASASASAAPTAPSVSPSSVQVNVLNGAGTAGLAAQAASALTRSDFHVIGTGNAVAPSATTIIQYSSADEAGAAKALAAAVTNAQVQPVSAASGVASDAVDLILGSNYSGLKSASAAPSPGASSSSSGSSSSNIGNVTKTFGGISGNANICGDKGAFSGPDQPSEFGAGS